MYLLKELFKPDVFYQKAGVMLMELVPEQGQQLDLLGYSDSADKTEKRMAAIDGINKRYGRNAIHFAAQGINNGWAMRRAYRSPNYTGDWKGLSTIGSRYNV